MFAMVLTRCSEFHYVNLRPSGHNLSGMDRLFLSVVRPSEVIGIRIEVVGYRQCCMMITWFKDSLVTNAGSQVAFSEDQS